MKLPQLPINLPMHGILRILPILILLARRVLHKQFDSLIDVSNWIDVEHSVFDCVHDFVIEDEVFDIGLWDQYALFSCESAFFAKVEETFDLVGDAADGLNLSFLVDGAGHGDVLADREFGKGGDDAVQFGTGGTVTVDAVVVLLEADAAGEGHREFLGVGLAEEAGDDLHAFVVGLSAHAGFFFDVYDAGFSNVGGGGDAGRGSECVAAHVEDG